MRTFQKHYTLVPRIVATTLFLFTACVPPLVVWERGSLRESEALEAEARMLAVTVSRFVGLYPDYWDMTPERLTYQVRDLVPPQRHLRVEDLRGVTVTALGVEPLSPRLCVTHELTNRHDPAGRLTLCGSLRLALFDTLLTALISVSLATLFTLFLWRKVLHAMRDTAMQVEDSRERFRKLTELSNDGYWATDTAGRFSDLSGGMARIGLGPDTALGRGIDQLEVLDQESRRTLAQDMAGRKVFRQVQVRLDVDGGRRWLVLSGQPLLGHKGEYLGYHGTATDVTDRRVMQEALIQSEKMVAMGELAAGMAHEINNPLGGILQSVQVIQRRLEPGRPANQDAARREGCTLECVRAYLAARGIDAMLEGILQASRKAAAIATSMLNFSRKGSIATSRFDMVHLVEEAAALGRTYFLQSGRQLPAGLTTVTDFRDAPLEVSGSRTELEQVLVNIIINAIQAMNGPGQTEAPGLTLRVFREADQAVVMVEDNGPGMNREVLKHIFDPFFTTKPTGKGTGLGLSVSYYIVTQNHGGTLSARSEPGQGAQFTLRLPLAGDNAQP